MRNHYAITLRVADTDKTDLQMPSATFIRFLLVGIVNTITGLSVIYACKWFLGFDDVSANLSGYIVGLTVSFTLNSRWTFQYRGSVWPAVMRFLTVFLVAYATNLFVVLLLIEAFAVNSYLAQAIGVPPYTLMFYAGSRWLAFREPENLDA